METIKSWAVSAVTAAGICAVFSFITPSGFASKSIKVLLAVFMIFCFLSPLSKVEFDFESGEILNGVTGWLEDSRLEKTARKQLADNLANEIESRIGAYLTDRGENGFEVNAYIEIDANDEISIRKIDIDLQAETDANPLRDFVISNFGIAPDITVKSEEDYG